MGYEIKNQKGAGKFKMENLIWKIKNRNKINKKRNWYKISFNLACIIWFVFVFIVLFFYFKPNKNINIKKDLETETIEQKMLFESQIKSFNNIEEEFNYIPFFEISKSDRYIIECIVAGEAKGESFRGMKLVAQCIMNAMDINNWDAETVRIQYKYSGWDPDLENSNPDVWAQIELAVSEVFDKGNLDTNEPILYFYAPQYSSGTWHENNLEYVLTEGGHKFFKLPS